MSGGEDGPADATYTASSFEPTPGYTQTRYDPSTMSRTDVDVVMEDIEQQLSLRPADERGSVNRDRKLLCMVALIVAVAVSVGVTMSKKGNVSSESEASVTLAAPPDYITSVCSPDMIALDSGRDKCEELCEVAVCCFVPDTDKVSCTKGNEAVCREYVAVCGNLDAPETDKSTDSGGSEGKDKVDDTIQDDNGAAGEEGDGGDTETGQEGGDDGSAPENEGGGPPAETDDLKSAIDSSCKTDVVSAPGGEAACEALCGPGKCCFSSGDQSCESEGSNVDCGEYASCAVIYTSDSGVAETGTPEDVAPGGDDFGTGPQTETSKAEVDSKCKGGATKTPEGLEGCQNICEQASCCFAHGDEYCLNAGLDVDCVHFSACEILHRGEDDDDDEIDDETDTASVTTTTTTTTTASVAVDAGGAADGEGDGAADDGGSTNTADSVTGAGNDNLPTKAQIDEACLQDLSNQDWKVTCEELCLPGKCCFDVTCGDDQGDIDCAQFNSCSRIYEGGDVQDSVTVVLAEACSEGALALPGGEMTCKEACEGSECCFDDTKTCTSIDCINYSLCSAVMGGAKDDKTDDGQPNGEVEDGQPKEGEDATGGDKPGDEAAAAEETGGTGNNEDKDLATAEKVIEKCSSDNLKSDRGREACEKLCINHLCCFATENDCKETLGTECLVYAACEALVEWSNEP